MLRMVNLLMALSLGVHREQLEQRMGLTWPRPFLLRPLFFLCSRGRSASDQVGVYIERARLLSLVGRGLNATEWMSMNESKHDNPLGGIKPREPS